MIKYYKIVLGDQVIGMTNLEKSDASMGVVFGEIISSEVIVDYDFIKSYCQKNDIELTNDYPMDRLISTRTINSLKVISPEGIEIKGLGNQISAMDGEPFEVIIEGIAYPFYGEEFPHHVKEYEENLK
jgi:hypothetical protein